MVSKYTDALTKYERTKMLSSSATGGDRSASGRRQGGDSEEFEMDTPSSTANAGNPASSNVDRPGLDVNKYATKKTIAQGMLDIALLTANASQLKYVLSVGEGVHQFYYLLVTLISISIALQVVVALLSLSLNMLRDCRLEDEEYRMSSLVINHISLTLVFAITLLNVLMSAIGYVGPSKGLNGFIYVTLGFINIGTAEERHERARILNLVSLVIVFLVNAVNIIAEPFKILVGIAILLVGNININKKENMRTGEVLNNVTVGLIFIISFINVIISSLGMESTTVALTTPLK